MAQHTYTVTGMTCQHCVASVTEEVFEIAGVTDVTLDLPTGSLVIESAAPLEHSAVAGAVAEAGYALA